MAEYLLRARADEGQHPIAVSSAGLLFDGRAAEQGAVAAMAKLGIDLRGHLSRTITTDLLRSSDLVLTMEFRQLREVVLTEGGDLDRTFTLPDLVVRAEREPRKPDESLVDWVARLAAGRSGDDVVRADRTLEVADPMGQSKRTFRRCAAEIDDYLGRFVASAWPVQDDADREPADAPADVEPAPSVPNSTSTPDLRGPSSGDATSTTPMRST